MKRLRVGIVGCGVIAPTHADSFRRQKNVDVVWACDLVEQKARRLAEACAIPRVTTDYRELMADPSVACVTVCTDHAAHVPVTVAALRNGKHVLCEKALAADRKGLNRMFVEHRRHPELVFGGVFQHRFDAVNRCAKKLVDRGAFGIILTAGVQVRCLRTNAYYEADAWRGTWAREGGSVLINQAIHSIDTLAWIMGGVESLCGLHANFTHGNTIETEDTAVALLRFRRGVLGTIEATCSSNLDWETTLAIHGSSGSLEIRNGDPEKVAFADHTVSRELRKAVATAKNAITAAGAKDYYGTGHLLQVTDFVSAMREKREPFVSARSARHAVDIVLGIYDSQRRGGKWVKIPAFNDPD